MADAYTPREEVYRILNAGGLTFKEFIVGEPLPLSAIHESVLDFLRGRDDVALFGAHAVNAYVNEPRMTQDVDVLATDPGGVAAALRDHLALRLGIAVRMRNLGSGRAYRIYQVRSGGNRHLADIRQAERLPATKVFAGVAVVAPAELVASKVIAYRARRGQPKSGTDWRDLAMILLAFPELKSDAGPVRDALIESRADAAVLEQWSEIVRQPIVAPADDEFA